MEYSSKQGFCIFCIDQLREASSVLPQHVPKVIYELLHGYLFLWKTKEKYGMAPLRKKINFCLNKNDLIFKVIPAKYSHVKKRGLSD